jgi:methyltransferase (TIGR00027 family)
MSAGDRPDFSAETVAAARAFSYREDRGAARNPDHLAHEFLGPAYRLAHRIRPLGRLAYRVWQRKIPGIAAFLNARTHHIDRVLRDEVAAGVRQVVILGAGYDTRAWRLCHALAGAVVFEVDRSGTQRRKRTLAARRLGGVPPGLRFVEVDFSRPASLFPALAGAGYDAGRPALFVWEGVSYYLTPADVDALLAQVAAHAASGSAIVFDYLYASVLTGSSPRYGAEAARRFLQRRGQPYRSGIPDGETTGFLADRGYDLVHDVDRADLWRAYLGPDAAVPSAEIFDGYGMALARLPGAGDHPEGTPR